MQEILIFAVCTIVSLSSADVLIFSDSSTDLQNAFQDMPADFGAPIPSDGIAAWVVYANPANACAPIEGPPLLESKNRSTWAVLIKRGDCNFDEKVLYAQKAQYDMAIIHNVGSNDLERMTSTHPNDVRIIAIFVGSGTGQMIQKKYLFSNGYYVMVDDDPFNPFNRNLLLPLIIVVSICFFTMIGFMVSTVIKWIKDRRRARRRRLPNSSLRQMPTTKYRKGDPYETCAICLDDFIEGEKLRVLPCSHAYHCKCIDPWLTKSRRVCPMCKRRVFARDERVTSDSDSSSDIDDRTPLLNSSQVNHGGTFNQRQSNNLVRQGRSQSLSANLGNSSGVGQNSRNINPFVRPFYVDTSDNSSSISDLSTTSSNPFYDAVQQAVSDALARASEASSHPAEDHGRHPAEDHGRHPAEDHGRHPSEDHGRHPAEDHGRHPAEDHGRHPAEDHGHHPADDHGRHPAEDHAPHHVVDHTSHHTVDHASDYTPHDTHDYTSHDTHDYSSHDTHDYSSHDTHDYTSHDTYDYSSHYDC